MKKTALLNTAIASLVALSSVYAVPDKIPDKIIPVRAPCIEVPKQQSQCRLWNLQDADILSVINEVSLETGKNFVVDPRVNGKISLISSKPIQPNQVYAVFLSILSLLGYSAISSGDVIKIVPNMESSEYATRVATVSNPGKGDEVVVRVIPLENVSANQLIPVIRPMLPQWSNVSAYTPGNVLILLGRASNLQRILKMVSSIDQAADNNIDVIPLRAASALQLVNVLNNLQNANRASGELPQASFAADERSNSILLSGNKASRLRMRILISQLDTPTCGAKGNTEVIYLRYLQAKNIAPILGRIALNMAAETVLGHDVAVGPPGVLPPPLPPGPVAVATRRPIAENLTNIQAEPSTNSLIITAPPAMMAALNSIIAKLDIRPLQVLIEGIIVEINQDDLKNLGIEWGGLVGKGDIPPGIGFSQIGQGVIGIIPSQQVHAVLNALQTTSSVNILSTPSVVVLDNHRATLDIGQDVPTKNGEYSTTATTATVTPFNTIAYKKVSLSLEVVPQINLGNSVRLTVRIKNDSLQNPDKIDLTPLINTSQITNSVIVNSCDILVLGGLIRNSLTDTVDKVPIIGDVPGIGLLFQHKTRKLEKKNLVVFLKPIILHSADDANFITFNKYEQTRNAQINWPVDLSCEGRQKRENILPLWKNSVKLPTPFE